MVNDTWWMERIHLSVKVYEKYNKEKRERGKETGGFLWRIFYEIFFWNIDNENSYFL